MAMAILVYMSDVSPWWTMDRQEATLADVLPGATVFRDALDRRQRRAHTPDSLVQRAMMLRSTARSQNNEVIHVASLAVLAWSEADLREVLDAIKARGAVLVSSEGINGDLVAAWAAVRRQSRLEGAALRGSAVSAERRKAASEVAVKLIAGDWPLPSKDHPTAELLARCGLSLNTVKAHLGPRPIAQYKHRLKQARKARTTRKEAHDNE
jgi:hypothetical protein